MAWEIAVEDGRKVMQMVMMVVEGYGFKFEKKNSN
jgi:hypothetical protein